MKAWLLVPTSTGLPELRCRHATATIRWSHDPGECRGAPGETVGGTGSAGCQGNCGLGRSPTRYVDEHLDVPLYWQCWKLDSPIVKRITDATTSAAADCAHA